MKLMVYAPFLVCMFVGAARLAQGFDWEEEKRDLEEQKRFVITTALLGTAALSAGKIAAGAVAGTLASKAKDWLFGKREVDVDDETAERIVAIESRIPENQRGVFKAKTLSCFATEMMNLAKRVPAELKSRVMSRYASVKKLLMSRL